MMAVVRNRRAMITGVAPFNADQHGRCHLVDVEYTNGVGAESEQLLWEVEPDAEVIEPSALPKVEQTPPIAALQRCSAQLSGVVDRPGVDVRT